MDIFNAFIEWFKNDLSILGTILIAGVAGLTFLYEVVEKVRKKENTKGVLFFIAYLITLVGLILIIIQSLVNIQETKIIKSRIDKIENHIKINN